MEEIDRVTNFFKDRHVFITGGTGFMGKVFVEKLLRITEIGKIYMLIRHKKNIEPKERLRRMFENPLFEKLKVLMTIESIMEKIVIIVGDCSLKNLGISCDDRLKIITNVSLIYHFCATIKFDEELKKAVELNTRGTREIIDLAISCKKLDLFVYVSTCYCHHNEKILFEKSYPAPDDPHKIIELVENKSLEEVEKLSNKILKDVPNTYTFTKALAEALVNEARDEMNLKALIIRPSIIISTYQDPIAGWVSDFEKLIKSTHKINLQTDNLNGSCGLMIAYGRGVMRTLHCDEKSFGDFIPVDVAINGLMVCSWNYVANNDKERNIINFATSSTVGQYSWENIVKIGQRIIVKKYPLGLMLWYPHCEMTKSRKLHYIRALFKHWIPAILIDTILMCIGMKPIMIRVHKKLAKGMEVLDYYTNNEWHFDNKNAMAIWSLINEMEKKNYRIDLLDFGEDKVIELFENGALGARRYLLKQPDESLPFARMVFHMMYLLDKLVTFAFYGFLMYWIIQFLQPSLDRDFMIKLLSNFDDKLN